MDILNPCAELIVCKYDGMPYHFEPGKVLGVHDDAGSFILTKYGRLGLVSIRYVDPSEDPQYLDRKRLEGIKNRTNWMHDQVDHFNAINARQEELKFPRLTKTEAIARCEVAIPIYEEKLHELEEQLGLSEAEQFKRELRDTFDIEVPEIPEFGGSTVEDLRQACMERGISYPPNANSKTLQKLIREHTAKVREQMEGGQDQGITNLQHRQVENLR